MTDNKVVSLTQYDLPMNLVATINAFDSAIIKAIDDVVDAKVHRGMIVGMLHAYAHHQTQIMCDTGTHK